MMKIVCLILWMLLLIKGTQAQEPAVQQALEDLTESFGSEPVENTDFQEVIDDLTYLSHHPISINLANSEQLQQLHFLSDIQINDLIDYRTRTGQIYSIYELASIEGFNSDVLLKLAPFISFEIYESGGKKSSNDIIARSTRSFSSSEDQTRESNYEGSMERYYLRFKHISTHYEYGMVGEKDPGESFLKGTNKYGFDYMGAYGNVKIGSAAKLFVGDYHIRFGQGLIANQSFSLGKSAETTQVFKFGQEIRSSSSTDENQFFRGVAAKLKLGIFTLMPILSWRQLDAHIDTINDKPGFGAFQISGYHRTPSEIAGKNALEQIVTGGSAIISIEQWNIGFTALHTKFNGEMIRNDTPDNQFLWEGKENLVAGLDWKGSIRNVFIFGEAAASANDGKAFLSGILFKPASNAELTMVYRNINKTYFSFFSNAFTESSRTNDEHGLYLGFKFYPVSRWTFSGYADMFTYRWIKYTTAAPSDGTELFAQASFKVSDRTDLYVRFFQEEKDVKVTSISNKYNQPQQIKRYRFNISQRISESIHLKSRVEWVTYSKLDEEKGILICQDVIYKPMFRKFSINARLAYFSTDSYNSRIYAYENDMLYSFSIPALYEKGIRTYLNVRQSFNENLSLWLKLAATYPLSQVEIEDTDEQTTKYELKVQLRYQF